MADKSIMLNLGDERSKKVAEVIGNKTCNKILDYLSENEATVSEISEKLKIPLNTVDYNIKKLVSADLIESSSHWWSVKGKKMPTYKLSNKKIIISPKKPSVAKFILFAGISVLLILIAASLILNSENKLLENIQIFSSDEISKSSELQKFSSIDDFNKFIEERKGSSDYLLMHVRMQSEGNTELMATGSDFASDSNVLKSSSDYSTTNIQVEGVDEADIVKTDGKYIYSLTGNKIVIVEAYPENEMKIISEINLSKGHVQEIYITNDKLIVFGNGISELEIYCEDSPYDMDCVCESGTKKQYECPEDEVCAAVVSYVCVSEEDKKLSSDYIYPRYNYKPGVVVYDISDKSRPSKEHEYTLDGNYIDSRMIGEYVYIVSNKYLNFENPLPPIYYIDGIKSEVAISDIYYPRYYDSGYQFTTISSINLEDGKYKSETYLLGSSYTLYASLENIYLTQKKSINSQEDYLKLYAEEIHYKLLPKEYHKRVNEILESDRESSSKMRLLEMIVEEYVVDLKGSDLSEFTIKAEDAFESFNEKSSKLQKTAIYKIELDAGKIEYTYSGEVPGRLLNQFSLDEYEGNLRVVTTTGDTWRENSLNHLYILDGEMRLIGSVEDLARGERIYSARFMGPKAYMVTFRQVDPLFVIDVENPEEPELLGYLKITGFSDYLHPFGENHLIGIGKETDEKGNLGGLKISIFDVRDFRNPKESAKIEIGGSGTYSDAQNDHKAVLFDERRGILVIPVQVYDVTEDLWYGRYSFSGVYVFDVSEENISVRGRITHQEKYEPKYGPASEEEIGAKRTGYYPEQRFTKIAENSWRISGEIYSSYPNDYIDSLPGGIKYNQMDYEKNIRRSLYIGENLYTISNKKIHLNNIENLDELDQIVISESFNGYFYY